MSGAGKGSGQGRNATGPISHVNWTAPPTFPIIALGTKTTLAEAMLWSPQHCALNSFVWCYWLHHMQPPPR